jgi:hypothetical protein
MFPAAMTANGLGRVTGGRGLGGSGAKISRRVGGSIAAHVFVVEVW